MTTFVDTAVVAIGQLVVDLVVRVDDDALGSLGIEKGRWQAIDRTRLEDVLAGLGGEPAEIAGGSAANTLVSLARLGVRTRLVGALGRRARDSVPGQPRRAAGDGRGGRAVGVSP